MAKNILICDDAAFMRMMIKDILTKNGYNVVGEAENGAKAVEKYQELKPDLVLMDITMPEMDGIQALKAIKAADPSATVIMCSAMGQQAMVIESIQSGAKDFIVKPFQQDLTVLTGVNGIVQLITVAVLFIIVLVMTYFTTRFIGNYQKGHLSCTNIQIIDTMRLSQNKLIQIVRTGDKYFAIAVCKDTVTLLGEINGDDIVTEQKEVTGEKFENILNRFRKKEQEDKQEDR